MPICEYCDQPVKWNKARFEQGENGRGMPIFLDSDRTRHKCYVHVENEKILELVKEKVDLLIKEEEDPLTLKSFINKFPPHIRDIHFTIKGYVYNFSEELIYILSKSGYGIYEDRILKKSQIEKLKIKQTSLKKYL